MSAHTSFTVSISISNKKLLKSKGPTLKLTFGLPKSGFQTRQSCRELPVQFGDRSNGAIELRAVITYWTKLRNRRANSVQGQ